MSNRTDFDNVASELVEMFGLNPDAEDQGTGKLQWRIERELHNAYVAGQEQSALDEAPETSSDENLALYEAQRLLDLMRSGTAITTNEALLAQEVVRLTAELEARRADAPSEASFNAVWDSLAEQGACDTTGGGEYERVKNEWHAAGKPDIEPFIRKRANVGPQ